MSPEQTVESLEHRLRELDEIIARMRHELIWRKREIRPGYEPVGVEALEQKYRDLSDEFTNTWRQWNELNRELGE